MEKIGIATQIYPLRVDAAKDLFAVLDGIRAAGYDGVEFIPGFKQSAAEIRKHADGIGLRVVSGHVSLNQLAEDLGPIIDHHRALGCEFIVLGFLAEADRHNGPGFARTLDIVAKAAEDCLAAGMPLAYHNHNFEFRNVTGNNGVELLLEGASALQAQFDTGWLGIAGQDPVAWLGKYAGRYLSVHLKDYLSTDGADGHDFCPIGMGALDYRAIVRAGIAGGAKWLIVDQDADARRPMMEALKLSRDFLRSLGF